MNSADYDGRTALHLAASEGHSNVVEYLINHNAQINAKDRWGNTSLDDAKRAGNKLIVELLESK